MTEKELIEEAKRRYPVGTRYYPAHITKIIKSFIVGYDQKIIMKKSDIYLENPDGLVYSESRNNYSYNQVLYYEGKWAEIDVSNQTEINTYGLKVGDKLPANILNKWSSSGTTRYQTSRPLWHTSVVTFAGDRKIESFKVLDGIVGFLVSGTCDVYLRAEGFKEFAESFNKPKPVFEFEVGKWYKYDAWYLKYSHTHDGIFIASEYIDADKKYASNLYNFTCGPADNGKVLITDLSEIQQYLPEGHPDKIKKQPEYIVGRWYRLGAWIGKFKELNGEKFCVFKSGTPFDNYKSFPGGHLSLRNVGIPELITDMTEVYNLFPEEKPDFSDTIDKIPALKYTLTELVDDKIIVYIDSKEEYNKISEAGEKIKNFKNVSEYYGKYCYNFKNGEYASDSSKTNSGSFSPECVIITIDDIIFTEDLELNRWYEKDNFIVYLYARNSVYGFHHDKWFESTGFSEEGLKLSHSQKVGDKFSKYIKNKYQIGDIVIDPYDKHVFKIQELHFKTHEKIVVPELGKKYGFLFYHGKWAEIKSDFTINLCTEVYGKLTPSYEEWIKETSLKQKSSELLLKSKNKKQKFVKLTEIKTIKL